MSNTNLRTLFAGLALGLATATAPSVAMAAHPLVDNSRLHITYTSSLCALTGDVMNDVEAPSACGIVATGFDKILKRGPNEENADTSSAKMRSGAELSVMSPTAKTWKNGHVAFCVRAGNSNKPIVGGFSSKDGMAYITPTSYRPII